MLYSKSRRELNSFIYPHRLRVFIHVFSGAISLSVLWHHCILSPLTMCWPHIHPGSVKYPQNCLKFIRCRVKLPFLPALDKTHHGRFYRLFGLHPHARRPAPDESPHWQRLQTPDEEKPQAVSGLCAEYSEGHHAAMLLFVFVLLEQRRSVRLLTVCSWTLWAGCLDLF